MYNIEEREREREIKTTLHNLRLHPNITEKLNTNSIK